MTQAGTLVFQDAETPLDELISQLSGVQVNLSADEVTIERAGHSKEGEVWSPQLLPYDDWTQHQDIETQVLRFEGQDEAYNEGLLAWGRLEFISDEIREKMIAQARECGNSEELAAAVVKRRVFGGDDDLRGAISVRQDKNGYVLVGIDIRRYAQAIGATSDLVVVLPAAVDGVPIVRVAAEAFVRRLVQGIDVRLLIIPDTVRSLGGDAFAALSCRNVHIGGSLEQGGEQAIDLSSVHPRQESIRFTVHERNSAYEAHDGNLFSKDGRTLLTLAPPYGTRCTLPEGIERVAPNAFCAGTTPPQFVVAPDTLEKVDSKAWMNAVWVCKPDSPLRARLAERGVRFASEQAVEHDGCWYDFNDQGAILVAGPPAPTSASARFAAQALAFGKKGASGASSGVGDSSSTAFANPNAPRTVLAIPQQVNGKPVVRIATRALLYTPETLIIPSTVQTIGADNSCLGTKRLTLSDGVREIGAHSFRSRTLQPPVLIPASVTSIGEGCFEYAVCRLAHNGAIVHAPADQLLSCFVQPVAASMGGSAAGAVAAVPFDFACYDSVLLSGKNIPDRLGAVLHRLAFPHQLTKETKAALVNQARAKEREAMQYVAREGNVDMVAALLDAGFITDENFDKQIELLRSCNRTDCVMFLMERHRKQAEAEKPASTRSRFAL